MEGDFLDQDRRFAEWYVWAKREVATDSRVCLGAAQAAMETLGDGADDQAARQAARGSTAGHGIALVSRIPARRRAYAEWYDWARREIGGPRDRLHAAATAALMRLDAGGDATAAASAARAGTGSAPQAPPPPPPVGPAFPAVIASAIATPAPPHGPPAQAEGPHAPAPPVRDPRTGAYTPQPPVAPPTAEPPPAPQQASYAPPQAPYGPPYASTPYAVQPLPPEAPAHAYAGFWRRAAAWLIDSILLGICLTILWFFISLFAVFGLLSSGQDITDTNFTGVQLGVLVIAFVLAWLYYAGLESSGWEATIGKRLMHLVVTDLYGRRLTFGRATARYYGKVVSAAILFVGYLMIAFTERRQGLHDLMAGTLVIRQQHLALFAPPSRPPEPQAIPGAEAAAGGGEVKQGA